MKNSSITLLFIVTNCPTNPCKAMRLQRIFEFIKEEKPLKVVEIPFFFFSFHSFIDWIFIILQRINRVKIEFKKKIIRNYNRWCAYNRIKRKEGKEIFVIIIIITATFYRSKNRFGWEKHATACLWKCRISIERLRKLD